MKVVTFYSYKGGVGRTMALVNTAYVFARNGWRVLMVDFDLEAPGMTHFFANAVQASGSRFDAVDFLLHAKSSMEAGIEEEPASLLESYVTTVGLPLEWTQRPRCGIPYLTGRLDLLPATLNPIIREGEKDPARRDYLRRMDQLSLARIFSARNLGRQFGLRVRNQLSRARFSAVGDLVFALREKVKAAYDVVFIDSRTGLNEVSGLSIGPLSDALVICCGLNQQNVDGTRFLMEKAGLIKRQGGKPFTVLAGPVPPWRDREVGLRLEALKTALCTEEVTPVPYHPSAALTETVFVADEPRGPMTKAFEDLAPKIVELIREKLPEQQFYKNFLNPPRKPAAMSSPRGPRIVAERLAKKRLREMRQIKELRGFLALFPTALTVSCLPSHSGMTLLDEDVGPVSLAAAVAAHRTGHERAFLCAEQLPVADDSVREKLAVRSTFFRWRALGKAPGDKSVSETFLKSSLWRAFSQSFDAENDKFLVNSGLKEAFHSGTAEDFVKKALGTVGNWPKQWWQLSWYDLCYIIDSIVLAIDLARAEPNLSSTVAIDLRRGLASLLSQRPVAKRIFPFRFGQSEEPWSRLFALMAGIRSPADLTPEDRAEVKNLLENKIIPIEPVSYLNKDLRDLWPSLLGPVFLDKVHFDLEEHGYMALGSWPEPLAAAATYCVWGETRIHDVIRWIALARMNYGFGWRVLLDWSLVADLKNHRQLAELIQRDDAEIRQVEEEIDSGIYAL